MTDPSTIPTPTSPNAPPPLPPQWQASLQDHLTPGETLLAWLETDLDARLSFATGLLAVTERRLLARAPAPRMP